MQLVALCYRTFGRRPWLAAGLAALGVRLLCLVCACLGGLFQVHQDAFYHTDPSGHGYFYAPATALDAWCRWDAIHYLKIAAYGYACAPDHLCTAFFPLFPALIAAVHGLVPKLPLHVCGLMLANLADVLGWVLVALWCHRRLPRRAAYVAFCAFVAFPTRNFGFSVYTEGLFLCLSVGAFFAYETRRFGLCGLLCALASATRPQGILVGAALAADAVWQRWRRGRAKVPNSALGALAAAPAGLAAYMAYLNKAFDQPLLFLTVQRVWKRHLVLPWEILGVHAEPLEYIVLLGSLALALSMVRRRWPVRDCAYVALSVLVPMSTGRFTSINRFVGILFPLFAAIGHVRGRTFWRVYTAVAVVYTCVFAFKLGQGAKVI